MDQQVAGEVISLKDEAAALGVIAAALVLNGAVVPDVPDCQCGRVLALLRGVGDGDGQTPAVEGGLLHRPDYDVNVHHHGHLSQCADGLLLGIGQLGLLDGDGHGFAGGNGFQRRFVQFHGAIREPDRQSCVLSLFGFGNDRGGQLHAVYLGKPGEIYRHRLCPVSDDLVNFLSADGHSGGAAGDCSAEFGSAVIRGHRDRDGRGGRTAASAAGRPIGNGQCSRNISDLIIVI